ncbi:MAG: hypothetical protein R2795_16970 [Saprospiraceae bacterium]
MQLWHREMPAHSGWGKMLLALNFNNKNMQHQHIYDKDGKQLCCTLEEKIYTNANAQNLLKEQHSDDDGHDHDHSHGEGHGAWRQYLPAIVSLTMFCSALRWTNTFRRIFSKATSAWRFMSSLICPLVFQ